MKDRLKVYVVDDHTIFRSGLRSEIASQVWISGDAGTVDGAIEGILADDPAVVLLDVHLPDGGGAAVIEGVRRAGNERAEFLALSASDSAEDVVAIIRAGARGYVTKTVPPDELVTAIRRVSGGDAYFSPQLAGYVLDAFAQIPVVQIEEELGQLTNREREVMQHLARGYTYAEIAETLVISIKTVETHASNVLRKLQLSNRHELSKWAHDRNIT
ncbi:LuxR C-terminal-related transcriptional regulator [Euzebya tangerina]|uniref:LuxR C-terminal-related transcriptional regulator n=1 Tax=Euzebya tangerina TaxID=591198 RepID=UPI000E30B95A|nr:response regulator transcription factor [Euzebya tangerina]